MAKLSRRDFLKISAGAVLASLLPKSLIFAEEKTAEISSPCLAVARGDKTKLVKAAVDALGGIDKFIKPGDRVCIKPNISFASNVECGATTSAGVVKQMVELCLDAGAAKVFLVDHTIQNTGLCIEKSKIEDAVIDKKKVALVTLTKERQFTEVEIPQGKELTSTKIAKIVNNVDKLINLPTAKSHSATGVSLGIKNLMGLVWDRGYFHHVNLHRAIAELATVIKSDLTVLDATRALTTGGPSGPGKTVELSTVIAGTDPVAVDSYTVGITTWYNKSFTGKSVKYIVAASKLGLGEIDPQKMEIKEIEV
ncbi:MAG TPA: DUF362 domain-containing protein [candidate division WOR-3 bacterium]|uniref:DUF362 domain-containing protein n=1 Tax=candidate division WOR-3 bacterium TaxID=2052148 RepID=A0A9C9EKP7_UNCW3|nr:DUF362 domain-containing protein [candidate division WOR-3 bacterium]